MKTSLGFVLIGILCRFVYADALFKNVAGNYCAGKQGLAFYTNELSVGTSSNSMRSLKFNDEEKCGRYLTVKLEQLRLDSTVENFESFGTYLKSRKTCSCSPSSRVTITVWSPLKNVERTLQGFSEPLLMKPGAMYIVFEHSSKGSCAYQKSNKSNLSFSELKLPGKLPVKPPTNTLSMWVWLAPLLSFIVAVIGFVVSTWFNCFQCMNKNGPPNENGGQNNNTASTRFTCCSVVKNIFGRNWTSAANCESLTSPFSTSFVTTKVDVFTDLIVKNWLYVLW